AALLPRIDQLADPRQSETLLLEAGDEPQAPQVALVVIADPACHRRRRQYSQALVITDVAGSGARLAGQLVHRHPRGLHLASIGMTMSVKQVTCLNVTNLARGRRYHSPVTSLATVSIVVPTLNEATRIEPCLYRL